MKPYLYKEQLFKHTSFAFLLYKISTEDWSFCDPIHCQICLWPHICGHW